MVQAGMRQEEGSERRWADPKVRGDLHAWLSDQTVAARPSLAVLLARLEDVKKELMQMFPQQPLPGKQVQGTCYPGNNAGYARHLDASKDSAPSRVLTMVW